MVRKSLCLLSVATLLLLAAGEVRAGGVGLFGSYGEGSVSAKRDSDGGRYEFDQDASHAGIGLVYDTNVLEAKPWSWRVALGYEKMDLDVDGGDGPFTDGLGSDYKGRLFLENDLGYGKKAGSRVRLWGGATTRLSFYTGNDDGHGGSRDQKVFGAGIGPVAGVNVGITDSVAISFKGGYLLSYYSGRWSDWTSPLADKSREDMTATEGNWFLNVAILFKTGDLNWGDEEELGDPEKKDDF